MVVEYLPTGFSVGCGIGGGFIAVSSKDGRKSGREFFHTIGNDRDLQSKWREREARLYKVDQATRGFSGLASIMDTKKQKCEMRHVEKRGKALGQCSRGRVLRPLDNLFECDLHAAANVRGLLAQDTDG